MASQPKAAPSPAVLVFGKPKNANIPQASWFRSAHRSTVRAAAKSLKFTLLDIKTDADRALLAGVHEGVLKSNGRVIVGSVAPEVYRRLEAHVGKAPVRKTRLGATRSAPRKAKKASEQNMNIHAAEAPLPPAEAAPAALESKAEPAASPSSAPMPDPMPIGDVWDTLRIGANVLGKYWEADGTPIGWWIGVITALDGENFIIQWPDGPEDGPTPPTKIERKHLAILHPSFDVATDWDQRPRRPDAAE